MSLERTNRFRLLRRGDDHRDSSPHEFIIGAPDERSQGDWLISLVVRRSLCCHQRIL